NRPVGTVPTQRELIEVARFLEGERAGKGRGERASEEDERAGSSHQEIARLGGGLDGEYVDLVGGDRLRFPERGWIRGMPEQGAGEIAVDTQDEDPFAVAGLEGLCDRAPVGLLQLGVAGHRDHGPDGDRTQYCESDATNPRRSPYAQCDGDGDREGHE